MSKTRRVVCSFCRDGKVKCEKCRDKGLVLDLVFYFMPGYFERCANCEGRGFKTCIYCDGNGYVEFPIEKDGHK